LHIFFTVWPKNKLSVFIKQYNVKLYASLNARINQ